MIVSEEFSTPSHLRVNGIVFDGNSVYGWFFRGSPIAAAPLWRRNGSSICHIGPYLGSLAPQGSRFVPRRDPKEVEAVAGSSGKIKCKSWILPNATFVSVGDYDVLLT